MNTPMMTPQNPDLARRMKHAHEFNGMERQFLGRLQQVLAKETGQKRMVVVHMMIQGDEDDTAFVQKFDDGSFEIVIDIRLSFGERCDYLIHEFAHIGSWDWDEDDDHGPEWGIEYARLYRLYLDVYDKWFSHSAIRSKEPS